MAAFHFSSQILIGLSMAPSAIVKGPGIEANL